MIPEIATCLIHVWGGIDGAFLHVRRMTGLITVGTLAVDGLGGVSGVIKRRAAGLRGCAGDVDLGEYTTGDSGESSKDTGKYSIGGHAVRLSGRGGVARE